MTVIAWRRFGGQVPRVHPRLLPAINAQKAVNVKLWNGKLRAFRRPKFDFTTVNPGTIQSIYKYRGGAKEGWLHWSQDVDVVKAPLAGDDFGRIYFTGTGRPKFADSTSVIGYTATVATAAASGVSQLTVKANRGFAIGDPVRITYSAGVTQDVTLTNVQISGGNLVLSFTPVSTNAATTSSTVRNDSSRFPLVAYDLGVPAPAEALDVEVLSGGTEGSEGVAGGTILSVEDIYVVNFADVDNATILQVQNGTADWTLSAHRPFKDVPGVMSDGQPMFIEAQCTIGITINMYNETRDVEFLVHRDPDGANIQVASKITRISRPSLREALLSGNANEWSYTQKVEATDVPVGGTYEYRMQFGPVPGVAGDDNNTFNVIATWSFKARYSNRIKLKLNTGHGLVEGDKIKLTITKTPDTPADRDLNDKVFEVLDVDGQFVTISAPYGGKYTSDGKWTKSFTPDETSDRAYVYTYVASFNGQDFESPPSPPSDVVTVALNGTVRLTNFINPTSPSLWDTNFTAIRVYRLSAGESTEAQYLFLVEFPVDTAQYDDSALGETLGEVLQTSDWELPPDDLVGLIELPEGGAAGFTKKEFCMAEPYFLHAWPARNRRTTHDEIVAIGAFGNSIGIATKGTPYVVTGLDPATVSMERIESSEPCQSKRGAVDLGYAFVYPSANGLMLLSVGRAEIVTGDIFTPEEWRALNPASFFAASFSGRYLCFYDATSIVPPPGVKYEFPPKGAFIFDPRDAVGTLVFLDIVATEAWTDPQTNRVYLVQNNQIREFDADRLELEYRWKSKEMQLAAPVSMGWGVVQAESYPLKFTVFAEGEPLYTRTVVNKQPFRLPDGEFDRWSVEVESVHQVEAIILAENARALADYQGGQ
jgi:hypothetical protein